MATNINLNEIVNSVVEYEMGTGNLSTIVDDNKLEKYYKSMQIEEKIDVLFNLIRKNIPVNDNMTLDEIEASLSSLENEFAEESVVISPEEMNFIIINLSNDLEGLDLSDVENIIISCENLMSISSNIDLSNSSPRKYDENQSERRLHYSRYGSDCCNRILHEHKFLSDLNIFNSGDFTLYLGSSNIFDKEKAIEIFYPNDMKSLIAVAMPTYLQPCPIGGMLTEKDFEFAMSNTIADWKNRIYSLKNLLKKHIKYLFPKECMYEDGPAICKQMWKLIDVFKSSTCEDTFNTGWNSVGGKESYVSFSSSASEDSVNYWGDAIKLHRAYYIALEKALKKFEKGKPYDLDEANRILMKLSGVVLKPYIHNLKRFYFHDIIEPLIIDLRAYHENECHIEGVNCSHTTEDGKWYGIELQAPEELQLYQCRKNNLNLISENKFSEDWTLTEYITEHYGKIVDGIIHVKVHNINKLYCCRGEQAGCKGEFSKNLDNSHKNKNTEDDIWTTPIFITAYESSNPLSHTFCITHGFEDFVNFPRSLGMEDPEAKIFKSYEEAFDSCSPYKAFYKEIGYVYEDSEPIYYATEGEIYIFNTVIYTDNMEFESLGYDDQLRMIEAGHGAPITYSVTASGYSENPMTMETDSEKDYDIGKPITENLKVFQVPKSNNGFDIGNLNSINVTMSLNTYWTDTLNSDYVATQFDGWDYSPSILSHVNGNEIINAKYTYSFPVEVNLLTKKETLSGDEASNSNIYYAKLSGDPLLSLLIQNASVGIIKAGEAIVNDSYKISDYLLDQNSEGFFSQMSGNYWNDGRLGSDQNEIYFEGDFSQIQVSNDNWKEQLSDAADLRQLSNYAVDPSQSITYRMSFVPKYEKFVKISLDFQENNYVYLNSSTPFTPNISVYVQSGKPLSSALMFDANMLLSSENFSTILERFSFISNDFYEHYTGILFNTLTPFYVCKKSINDMYGFWRTNGTENIKCNLLEDLGDSTFENIMTNAFISSNVSCVTFSATYTPIGSEVKCMRIVDQTGNIVAGTASEETIAKAINLADTIQFMTIINPDYDDFVSFEQNNDVGEVYVSESYDIQGLVEATVASGNNVFETNAPTGYELKKVIVSTDPTVVRDLDESDVFSSVYAGIPCTLYFVYGQSNN